MAKNIILILCFMGYLSTLVYAEESIPQLLSNDDWKARDKAISLIRKDFDRYQSDESVKEAILSVLIKENDYLKYLREKKLIRSSDGRGEYYLSILKLVVQLDMPEATEALLDSAGSGNKVQYAIVKRLIDAGKDSVKTLLSLKEKVESPDLFYKGNRSAYLGVIEKYLQQAPVMTEQTRAIVRDIIIEGLTGLDPFAKQSAIRSSVYFPEDAQMLEQVRKISTEDDYTRIKEGVKVFPLREEALKTLHTAQEFRTRAEQ